VALLAVFALCVFLVRSRRAARARHQILTRRLDLALEAGGMGTWVWDRETGRLMWDGRLGELYGAEGVDTVEAWMSLVDDEDRLSTEEAVLHSMEDGGQRFEVVHRLVLPDGSVRWLELRGEPIYDSGNDLLGTAGVVVDVTREREDAAELAASRSSMERLLDLAPSFSIEEHAEDVPLRICEAAMTLFDCDACGIWAFEGGVLRPVVSHPDAFGVGAGPPLKLPDIPLLRERIAGRAPTFVVTGRVGSQAIDDLLRSSGLRCGYVVPLNDSGQHGLVLTMWWTRLLPRPGLGEQAVVRRFGDQVALALEQARSRAALEEVQSLGEALQTGLLPAPSLRDERIVVTERYRPTEQRILLGGDFYDVVERPDGSIGFVVGDVTGHGPGPAAVGTALRAAWRALVLTAPDPASWLDGLKAAHASYNAGMEVLATACTGIIDVDRTSILLAGAGHPAPMLIDDTGVRAAELPPATPIGVEPPGTGITTVRFDLQGRWRLLLYTDGVIDVRTGRRSSDRIGEDGLRDWLAVNDAADADPDELLDGLVQHLEQLQHAPLNDDLALVLVECTASLGSGS
jgi:PAS domain S-box-containing protein